MRIREFQQLLRSRNIPVALFLNTGFAKQDPTIHYFTGVQTEYGILAVFARKNPVLYVPLFEVARFRSKSIVAVKPLQGFQQTLMRVVAKSRRVGINATLLSLAERKLIKKPVVDVSKHIIQLRAVKTKREILYLQKSADASVKILQATINRWKEFQTEHDVYQSLLLETMRNGLEPSFSPIVASGTHAAKPHHEPTHKKIRKGFCVLDFGVKYKGYCSDITRTIYVGTPSKKEKEMYTLVLHSQAAGIHAVRSGVACKELYVAANELRNMRCFFTHGLGHGIGVEIHEAPNVGMTSKEKLKEGMTITIEPGIYPRIFGIRIEDDVLVTKNGSRILTRMRKDLVCVPKH